MECPICNEELDCIDYFYQGRPERFTGTAGCGLHYPATKDYKVIGDIYKCNNEDCEGYQESYHTHRENPDDLHEGYPC
jgi:hypothetical protein